MPETIEQMLDDLHGIIAHLQRKYQIEKLVLLGHSWGSVLGSLYALRHPENVLSYIGTGQVISMMENERTAFQEVWKMAEKAGNRKHLLALGNLGDYPPDDPELLLKKLPKLRKIQAAYDNGPGSGSGQGELLKLLRRSPSFRWNDLRSDTCHESNHPHLQLLSLPLPITRLTTRRRCTIFLGR
ncbi:MAG: alpha/beta fold hydrolase [Eisenbergiella sp.]